MSDLLEKIKSNLIISHNEDDALLKNYIDAATCYAESYQNRKIGYYLENPLPPLWIQTLAQSASHRPRRAM